MVLICFTFCCLFANQGCHLVLHVLFLDLKVDCFFLLYVTLCCGLDFAAAGLSVLRLFLCIFSLEECVSLSLCFFLLSLSLSHFFPGA